MAYVRNTAGFAGVKAVTRKPPSIALLLTTLCDKTLL
jgi:hypothetical protein